MATPTLSNLYGVSGPNVEGNQLLNDKERDEYHTLTVQCLYVPKRGRPALHTTISFHCTRVQKADSNDQKKLGRTICHLIATIHILLIIQMNDHGIIE